MMLGLRPDAARLALIIFAAWQSLLAHRQFLLRRPVQSVSSLPGLDSSWVAAAVR